MVDNVAPVNVLYLHQHFATRSGAGGTRSYEFARHLLAQGHRVTMVASRRQGGGIPDARMQQVDGIDVLSLGGWYSNRLPMWRRMLSFARFTVLASLLRARQLPARPDVVVASSTPLTIGIPGALLARRFGVPFVFEVRDLWPQAPIELGMLRGRVPIALARALERWLYRRADAVVALSPGMADGVLAAGGAPERLVTIPNASDTDLFDPQRRDRTLLERWGLADSFVAVHAGSMGRANGLEYVIEAARVLHERGERDVQVLIAGDGGTRPALAARVRDLGLDNVTFAGSVPRSELGAVVSSCDVAIVSFADYPVLATNSPNKLFDGLAAGLPCIVNSPGWTRDLVREHDAGDYVDVRDPVQLADALVRYRDDAALRRRQGAAARRVACEVFERGLLARRFAGLLDDVIAGRLPRGETETTAASSVANDGAPAFPSR